MEKYGIIYKIRNKINNKIYIGQTIRKFKKRYSGELEKRTHNEHLKRSIQKYGIENFEIDEEFDIAYSKEELDKLEDMYIKIYNCCDENYGYNNKFGGANGRFSEQTKQKLKESSPHLSGENHPFYGKHHTEEAKRRISKANKENMKGEKNPNYGKHLSEEAKENLRIKFTGSNNANYGKHLSEEHKQKLREANLGKKLSEKTKIKLGKPVYCEEKQEIRLMATQWEEELGVRASLVGSCCTGKRKSTGGYHFRYATEEEIREYKKSHNIEE